ncbi:hypothetical protein HYQ44_018329 [Verticillium longisporum]|nr:hypothetical protein HYQ44_018329 [Verticillium longisporum]
MASPLSPAKPSSLNIATPPTIRRYDQSRYEVQAYTEQSTTTATTTTTAAPSTSSPNGIDIDIDIDASSSSTIHATAAVEDIPLQQKLQHKQQLRFGKENNMSPPKQRHSRIMSGNELSPLKILTTGEPNPERQFSPARGSRKSLMSPDKRFPVRVSNPISETADKSPSDAAAERPDMRERTMSLDDALRSNKGLSHAIDIFEDDTVDDFGRAHDTSPDATDRLDRDDHGDHTEVHHEVTYDDSVGPDDTMTSTFSAFSAVPNLTTFARLGNSPPKTNGLDDGMTPRGRPGPSPARSQRPMSYHPDSSGNTTNLLMDFTEHQRHPGKSPGKRFTTGTGSTVPATPARQMGNLLDFDIPPLPTPRSIPTITPRELESLKSSFLSEISSLKASLSGKEAEALALKTAVGDAEKRVGECMEQVREMSSEKEHLAAEKEGWEKRSREMETVLRSVKEEIVRSQRETEELEYKLSESEARREAAENMAQEAESKLAGMRAGRASEDNARSDKSRSPGAKDASKEVEMAVERVARELHALYKSKHETKVTALKKSYEGRWEKRVRDLETRLEDVSEENERLRLGRDATMTRVDPAEQAAEEERKAQAVRDAAQIRHLGAEVDKLEAMMHTIRDDNSELRTLLEQERVEKGELVQLAEEMMSMQSFVAAEKQKTQPKPQEPAPRPDRTPVRTPAKARTPGPAVRMPQPDGFRSSVTRASGLKAPGSSIVMPGRSAGAANHERTRSGAAGLPRPGSGFGARSGIMSSIEKMGNYRGRAE